MWLFPCVFVAVVAEPGAGRVPAVAVAIARPERSNRPLRRVADLAQRGVETLSSSPPA